MKFHVYGLQIDENSYFNVEIFRASFLSIEHLRRPSMFKPVHTLKFNCSTLFFLLQFNFINYSGKNVVFNFQYSPQTQSVGDVYVSLTALK